LSNTDPGADCGAEITQDTTLERDLVCERGPALVIAADGVTLDLGGHSVSCNGTARSHGPGILLREVSRSTVRNGTVEQFDAGVVVEGGSANVVENLTVRDNVGSTDGDLGDGIVVTNSRENRIESNTVERNGPFSGISLGLQAQGNMIRGNAVTDNNMLDSADPASGRQTMGIRVEGPEANRNTIAGNTVTGSGGDGISVLATCETSTASPRVPARRPTSTTRSPGTRPTATERAARVVASGCSAWPTLSRPSPTSSGTTWPTVTRPTGSRWTTPVRARRATRWSATGPTGTASTTAPTAP